MKEWEEQERMTTIREIEIEMINDEMSIWAGNIIGAGGARTISESLKTNSTLATLILNSDEQWYKT